MFTLTIETDGAAFTVESNDEDNGAPAPGVELARILRELAERMETVSDTGDAGTVRDSNGRTVGRWNVTVDIVGPETLAAMLSASVGTDTARRIAEEETADGPITRHRAERLADEWTRESAAAELDD